MYVATCSPARDAGAGYVAWGHSTLVGPVSQDILSILNGSSGWTGNELFIYIYLFIFQYMQLPK